MNYNKDLFEKTEGKEFGEFETLKLGGHEVKIMNAEEYTGQTGNISLKVMVDIDGNDKQKGWFKKQYDENTNMDKKWPTGACRYLSLKDEQIAYLKGFITALEKSNPGFKFDKDGTWKQLNGLKVAGVFGLEEYLDGEEKVRTATKLTQFRSLDKLNEINIPAVKLLDGSYIAYEDYKPSKVDEKPSEIIIGMDDLPF